MKEVINWLLSINPSTWTIIGSALGVSVLTQAIKHWLSIENPKVIIMLTSALSFISVGIVYLTYYFGQNPYMLGDNAAKVLGVATIVYRIIVQPFYSLLIDAKTYRSNKTAQSINDAAVAAISVKEDLIPTITDIEKSVNNMATTIDKGMPTSDEFAG